MLDGLHENERRALATADNRLPLSAGWDDEMLRLEIEAPRDADYDLDLIGFEDDELRLLVARREASSGLTQEDSAPKRRRLPWWVAPTTSSAQKNAKMKVDSTGCPQGSPVAATSET